jgi:hypothetical protein
MYGEENFRTLKILNTHVECRRLPTEPPRKLRVRGVHERPRARDPVFPTRSFQNAGSLNPALGYYIPGRVRDVSVFQVALRIIWPAHSVVHWRPGQLRADDFHSSRARVHYLWSCTSTRSLCRYGLFRSCGDLTSLSAQLLLSTPTLHFFVMESVVQQVPWIRVAWLNYVCQWDVWSALALCSARCRHQHNKDDSASFSRKDTHS